MNGHKTLIITIVCIVVFFPFHLFGGLDFFKAVQGYSLEDNYNVYSFLPNPSAPPGISLNLINLDIHAMNAEVVTLADTSEYGIAFSQGDEITIYINDPSSGMPSLIKGKILSVGNTFINEHHNPSIKYFVHLRDQNDFLAHLNLQNDIVGNMIDTSKDRSMTSIHASAIKTINNVQYVCVVTKTVNQEAFWDGYTTLIKFKLKEIKTNPKAFFTDGNDTSVEITEGIKPEDKMIISRYNSYLTRIWESKGFDCGDPS